MDATPKIIARSTTDIIRSLSACHHKAKTAFIELEKELIGLNKAGLTKARFEVFETLRSPFRQDHLFAGKTSKARAWESAHNYGLAVDYVPRISGRWTWLLSDLGDYDMINFRAAVGRCGLIAPVKWDPFHVEHPLWVTLAPYVID